MLTRAMIGVDAAELRRLDALRNQARRTLPRHRPKKTFNMESGLTTDQRMELMMSGGARKAKRDMLEGAPQEIARKLKQLVQ